MIHILGLEGPFTGGEESATWGAAAVLKDGLVYNGVSGMTCAPADLPEDVCTILDEPVALPLEETRIPYVVVATTPYHPLSYGQCEDQTKQGAYITVLWFFDKEEFNQWRTFHLQDLRLHLHKAIEDGDEATELKYIKWLMLLDYRDPTTLAYKARRSKTSGGQRLLRSMVRPEDLPLFESIFTGEGRPVMCCTCDKPTMPSGPMPTVCDPETACFICKSCFAKEASEPVSFNHDDSVWEHVKTGGIYVTFTSKGVLEADQTPMVSYYKHVEGRYFHPKHDGHWQRPYHEWLELSNGAPRFRLVGRLLGSAFIRYIVINP